MELGANLQGDRAVDPEVGRDRPGLEPEPGKKNSGYDDSGGASGMEMPEAPCRRTTNELDAAREVANASS